MNLVKTIKPSNQMKKLSIFLGLLCLTYCLYSQQCTPTECLNLDSTCSIVGGPFVPAIDGMNTILARSVEADGLTFYNTEAREWNPCWIDSLEQYTDDSCDNPCNCNNTWFCPETYCSVISGIADLSPALISRAAGLWDGLHRLTGKYVDPNNKPYYEASKQLICDINATFDCRGLLRPFVQAGIFENIPADVNHIGIPSFVLDDFSDDPESSELSNYTNSPSPSFERFKQSRMIYSSLIPSEQVEFDCGYWAASNATPDIRKIETRMFFYYLATIYIDLGFTSLHMGQLPLYSYCDEFESDLIYAKYLLNKIRSYAENLDQPLLITSEAFNGDIESGDTLLLDYYSNPARVREVLDVENEPHFGDDANLADLDNSNGENPNCHPYGFDNKIDSLINDIFGDGSPCDSNDYPGIIHPCHGVGFGQGLGGVNFNGITVDPLPYTIYLDFAGGLKDGTAPFDDPAPFSYDTSSNTEIGEHIENTWGFDDKGWFYHLSNECKQHWLSETYCFMRRFDNNRANLQIPAFSHFNFWDVNLLDPTNLADSCKSPRREVLINDPDYINLFQDVLEPIVVDSIYFNYACGDNLGSYCSPRFIKTERIYSVLIKGIDCSSKFSWHIAKLDTLGNPEYWLDISYDIGRIFTVSEAGMYRIYLRQDNYGLEPADQFYGVNQIFREEYLEPYCCVFDHTEPLQYDVTNERFGKIGVSPNPNKGQFVVNYQNDSDNMLELLLIDNFGTIRVIDSIVGKSVFNKDISVTDLHSGIYTIVARDNFGSIKDYHRVVIVE